MRSSGESWKFRSVHDVHRAVTPITDFVQHWYGARGLFNSFFEQNMCEPIAERVRQVLRDRVGELLPSLTEPELFFPGEFVLAMVPIDLAIQEGFPRRSANSVARPLPAPPRSIGGHARLHHRSIRLARSVLQVAGERSAHRLSDERQSCGCSSVLESLTPWIQANRSIRRRCGAASEEKAALS